MKTLLISFSFICLSVFGKAQTDSLSTYLNMSFEELLQAKVNVSSTKSENVFHTPSTVSVISREMINQYNFTGVAEMKKEINEMLVCIGKEKRYL